MSTSSPNKPTCHICDGFGSCVDLKSLEAAAFAVGAYSPNGEVSVPQSEHNHSHEHVHSFSSSPSSDNTVDNGHHHDHQNHYTADKIDDMEIYLDCNATTPVMPLSAAAVTRAITKLYGNPSSSHLTGLRARHLMESTRDLAKEVIGAGCGDLIFTSGATEAIGVAVLSVLTSSQCSGTPKLLLYGATEHKAVPYALRHWKKILRLDHEVVAIPVDERGLLDLEFIREKAPDALMICTMAVNNETGVRQDLKQLEQVIRTANPTVCWMVDSVQALGKLPLKMKDISIDYAPFSGHKLYAMKGIGMLYVRKGAPFMPMIEGGGQEHGKRSGTENLPGIASLRPVFKAMLDDQHETFRAFKDLDEFRDRLANTIRSVFPTVVFNNDFSTSVPTTLNFSVPGLYSKELLNLFDAANIRVSSGSACSSNGPQSASYSYVLAAMKVPPELALSAVRMSFGPACTSSFIDLACDRLKEAARALRNSCRYAGPPRLMSPAGGKSGNAKAPLFTVLQFREHGQLARCTWLVIDGDQAVVIDPHPNSVDRIVGLCQCRQTIRVVAVLETHNGARCTLRRIVREGGPCCSEGASAPPEQSPSTGLRQKLMSPAEASACDEHGWPTQANAPTASVVCGDGQARPALRVGKFVLVQVPCPGHSFDSCGYLLGVPTPSAEAESGDGAPLSLPSKSVRWAFSGDMVISGGLLGPICWHTDEIGCRKSRAMFQSLKTLTQLLTVDTILCPAHDLANTHFTTVRAELSHCGLLSRVLGSNVHGQPQLTDESQFVKLKRAEDRENVARKGVPPASAMTATATQPEQVLMPNAGRAFIETHPKALILDVREQHENALTRIPFKRSLNVPVDALPTFAADLVQGTSSFPELADSTHIVCYCRSGNRSLVAMGILSRLTGNKGIPIYQMSGGNIVLGMN